MKLEHVAINVIDPEAMAAWYQEHLDMKIVMAQATGMRMHFLADNGGSMLELYNNPDAPLSINGDINPLSLHFAFATDDIEDDRARLSAAGATPVGEITSHLSPSWPSSATRGICRSNWFDGSRR